MKIKTIIFLIILTIIVFVISVLNKDNKIYYVNISTTNSKYNENVFLYYKNKNKLEKYVNTFSNKDYRTTDLIRSINDNEKINNQTIQNALIKADILTLNIGNTDINYKIVNTNKEELYEYTDQVLNDIENLLKLVRNFCKEKIYIIGYLNDYGISYNEYFEYTNKRLKLIAFKYNINFIDVSKFNKNDINNLISNKIINDN